MEHEFREGSFFCMRGGGVMAGKPPCTDDEGMNERMDERMDEGMTKGWTKGWTKEWTKE